MRLPPAPPPWRRPWLRAAATLVALTVWRRLAVGAAWALLVSALWQGQDGAAPLAAWALLLFAQAPLRALEAATGARFAAGAGARLRAALFDGLVHGSGTEPAGDADRLAGAAFALETAEIHARDGAVAVALAALELGVAWALVAAPGGSGSRPHPATAWRPPERTAALIAPIAIVAALAAGLRHARARRAWTAAHRALTHQLLDALAAWRTHRAQEPPARRHTAEDAALAASQRLALPMDATAIVLRTVLPRCWLTAALASFLPSAAAPIAQLAAVFLTAAALSRLGAGLVDLAAAAAAWPAVAPLLSVSGSAAAARRAGAARPAAPSAPAVPTPSTPSTAPGAPTVPTPTAPTALAISAAATAPTVPTLPTTPCAPATTPPLAAIRLCLRLPGRTAPLLDACSLTLRHGDRVLLGGPSGGGKSALAALLGGTLAADAGLLLLGGTAAATLSKAAWRRQVVAVPPPGDNHLFAASLARNLLLSTPGTANPPALAEAAAVCRELGLGGLLDRMPQGLHQPVGEAGWALSQGEACRVLLARALLQHPRVLILDESIAALDPDTARQVLAALKRRARTLLLIAHR